MLDAVCVLFCAARRALFLRFRFAYSLFLLCVYVYELWRPLKKAALPKKLEGITVARQSSTARACAARRC